MTATDAGSAEESARQSALAAHLAFLGAVGDVSGSTRRVSSELSRLRASHLGIAGPRLEAAMMGSLLLATWVDFLNLVDVSFKQGFRGVETLFVNMDRWRKMLEPSMKALSSLEPGQVEAAANDIPALMSHLSGEFNSTAENIRVSMKRVEQVIQVAQLVEMVTMLSAMKFSLPSLRPSAPATPGVGLMVGGDGVRMGTRVVVCAEWVEMMRRLVRAGVLSLPAVSATVRIHAGQVMMAESHDELPKGVREALGDGPEVRGMRVTGKTGAGMAELHMKRYNLPMDLTRWRGK